MPHPRRRTWKIIDHGEVARGAKTIHYPCPGCAREAELPVCGVPLAISADGAVVFEAGPRAVPKTIECRACRRRFGLAA